MAPFPGMYLLQRSFIMRHLILIVGQILLELISLDYSDTFMAASGTQAEEVRLRSMKDNWGKYILITEGSVPLGSPGYCTIAGKSAKQVFDEAARGPPLLSHGGNCASSGCIRVLIPTRPKQNRFTKSYPGNLLSTCKDVLLLQM